jgi:hypothetical protein
MTEKIKQNAEPDWSEYRGVLVVVEQRDGKAKPVSWQLLGIGRKLAQKLEVDTLALVMGHDVEHLAREAVYYGADKVYIADDPVLKHYRTYPYSRVCLELFRKIKPEIVLFGATYTGRDVAGAIATHLATGRGAPAKPAASRQPSGLLGKDGGDDPVQKISPADGDGAAGGVRRPAEGSFPPGRDDPLPMSREGRRCGRPGDRLYSG